MNKSIARKPVALCLLIMCTTCLSACNELVDYAIDCLDDDRPQLRPNELAQPVLNQTYDQTIRVSIRNEPFDDNFNYRFTLSGQLPEGIQTQSAGREYRLFGTPIELGDFRFSVRVEVSGNDTFNDTSGLCSTVDTNNYSLTVQIME